MLADMQGLAMNAEILEDLKFWGKKVPAFLKGRVKLDAYRTQIIEIYFPIFFPC